jgi:hypothetical protein
MTHEPAAEGQRDILNTGRYAAWNLAGCARAPKQSISADLPLPALEPPYDDCRNGSNAGDPNEPI